VQVKTSVKAGGLTMNHNEVRAAGLAVKSGVKAGGYPPDPY
jgi:hypothetical protein